MHVLLNRYPSEVETYNDIDGEVVNFFRVLRTQKGALIEAIGLTLLWLPVIVAVQVALMLGLGLLLGAINVYLRDTQQLVEVGLLAWFFLTPIIYPIDSLSAGLQLIIQVLNPVASLVGAYRHILYAGDAPNLMLLGVTALQALLALAVGALVFRRLSPSFAEEV